MSIGGSPRLIRFRRRGFLVRVRGQERVDLISRARRDCLGEHADAPADPSRVVASTELGLVTSGDDGRTWSRPRSGPLALLTWPQPAALYRVDDAGEIARSRNEGASWKRTGSVNAQPAAFASAGRDLYVALADGTVKRSTDGGRSWTIRTTP